MRNSVFVLGLIFLFTLMSCGGEAEADQHRYVEDRRASRPQRRGAGYY
jgi:hypothetical protein